MVVTAGSLEHSNKQGHHYLPDTMSEFFTPPPLDELSSADLDTSETILEKKEDQIDNYVANALKQMTLEDRENVYYGQHGVSEAIEEEPQMVTLRLKEMEAHLSRLKERRSGVPSEAFRLAESQSPEYVNDHEFRLQFLRTDSFNARKAAVRMIRYFDFKRLLFGDEKLCKDISMQDLTEDDMVVLRKGFMQALPFRDRAGRVVYIIFPSHEDYKDPKSLGRIHFMSSSQSDDTMTRLGIVIIVYHLGPFRPQKFHRKSMYMGTRAMSDLPVRIAAIHNCFSDKKYRFFINIAMSLMRNANRAKSKLHYGTHTECMYSLMTYGIPDHLIPVTGKGEIKRKSHLQLIERRKILGDYTKNGTGVKFVEIPHNNDILLGKGKPIQEHMGNMRLKVLVDGLLSRYDACTKMQKKDVAIEVVQFVKNDYLGRFLSDESGVWIEVMDDIAREKVSHLFRNRRRQAKTESERRQDTRSTGMRSEFSDKVENTAATKRIKVV